MSAASLALVGAGILAIGAALLLYTVATWR